MLPASGEDQALAQRRTTLVSILAASLLVALKLGVGLATGSLGLISAGVESSGDVVAAVLTFFAVRLGGRPADPEHPYGHRRAENLGALGEAAILLVGGLLVAGQAIAHLISEGQAPETPWYVFATIAVALVVDLTRTVVSLRTARRYDSAALHANAFHFAGDMVSSVVVLVGLALVRAGFAQADALAALVVACVVLLAATRLILENANVLMDRTPAEAQEAAERAITDLGADIELGRLRLRESGGRYFADVVVTVPPGQAVIEGHQRADLIEAAVQDALPGSDVVVHIEPRLRGLDLRERVLAIALAEPLVSEAHDVTIYDQEGALSVALHLKFPADLDLRTAHQIATRVEQAIAARPGVVDVQTHLEPLEQPIAARAAEEEADLQEGRPRDIGEVERTVREHAGTHPLKVRLLPTADGRVIFLTLQAAEGATLADAHLLAGELEEELRQRLTDIADVVIHTVPGADRRPSAAAP
jgi:cation diffusion facilitator family transporter